MKNIKRIVLLSVAIVAMIATSCSTKTDLNEVAKEISKDCPKTVGEALEFTGAVVEQQNLVYNFSYDAEVIDSEAFIQAYENVSPVEFVKSNMEDLEVLLMACAENGKGFEYRYTGSDGEVLSLELSLATIREALGLK